MEENRHNTARITLGGVLGALVLVCLFLASFLPTGRLALYALSSFFVSVIVMEFNIKTGWLFYIATCLLSLAVIPGKLELIPYVVFFGIYGLVKFHIEKIGKIIPEYILKFVYFNICILIAWYFASGVLAPAITVNLPWLVLVVILEVVFFVYDYVYTLFIVYYRNNLKKLLRI